MTDNSGVPPAARRDTPWQLMPVAGWAYLACAVVLAIAAPGLALVFSIAFGVYAAVLVHRELASELRPTFWWTFGVLVLGALVYVPYTYARRRFAEEPALPWTAHGGVPSPTSGSAGDPPSPWPDVPSPPVTREWEAGEADRPQILGPVIAAVGAAAALIAVFLPAADWSSVGFSRIAGNSLISNGDGWVVIALAIAATLAIWRAFASGRNRGWWALVCGIVLIAIAIAEGSSDALTVYPLDRNGDPIEDSPLAQRAGAGSGVYLTAVGGGLVLLGGLLTATLTGGEDRRLRTAATASPMVKSCPDCAEQVLAAARICRYCRHEFTDTPSSA